MTDPLGDLHIDDFCKDTAKTLLYLYKKFPTKTTLYVEDIAGPDEPDEFGLHSPRFEACFNTFLWLKESDYISYKDLIRQEAVEHACLTHRGFSFLASYESHSDEGIPQIRRIDKLKANLRAGTSEALKDLVLHYMVESRDYK